ncbi:MAG: hypothetical protein HFG70_06640 [Hungatella sp.]|jgi:sugar diacid utilization regulator|nr:hypothetical protein [Hungatella sp.]
MFENKIMYEIIEKLQEGFPIPISICDGSGRVMVSTDSSSIGDMNLLAIKALDINAGVFASPDSRFQKAGAAIPLMLQSRRIGAMVVEQIDSLDSHTVELLAKTIELLYQEIELSRKQKNQSQERNQFLYKWLHLQSSYTGNFIKEGELLGIDITGNRTILVIEDEQADPSFSPSNLQNLLDKQDILLPLSHSQTLIILKENEHYERKYHRILSAWSGCHTGVCCHESHLNTAYGAAMESLTLGKLLFPHCRVHDYEHMRLAVALSHLDFPGLEKSFALLAQKGKAAQLAETVAAYIHLNGDIRSVCETLHIHRNSIPYRLRRIQELCGKNLTDSYDMLYLYASMIRYVRIQKESL